MKARVVIDGEVHLALDIVAECYHVEVDWLQKVYREGLLGPGHQREHTVVIAAARLDRVAQIVRLHFHYGIDLEAVSILLGVDDPDQGSVSWER